MLEALVEWAGRGQSKIGQQVSKDTEDRQCTEQSRAGSVDGAEQSAGDGPRV